MVLRKRRLGKGGMDLEMAPMIDVVFLLLIFFMVTATFRQFETQMRSAMAEQKPSLGPNAKADFENVLIDIRDVGGEVVYACGTRQCRSLSELRRVMSALPVQGEVFVRAAPSVPIDHPVAAIRVAKDAGFRQVCFLSPGD